MYNLLPSRQMKLFFGLLILMSILLTLIQPIDWFIKLILVGTICIISYYIQLNKYQNYQLQQLDKNHWILESPNHEIFEGKLQGDSLICACFCIVILKSTTTRKSKKILILSDMLPKAQFHRLKLQLKGHL